MKGKIIMSNTKLSPPWYSYYNKIKALFEKDPDVEVYFDDESYEVKIFVSNDKKADALAAIFPTKKSIGNIDLRITVYVDHDNNKDILDLFSTAFEGNPIVSYITSGSDPLTSNFNYVVFKPDVVQFFNDDLTDVNGNYTSIYADIAKEIFENTNNVYFCTDKIN